MLKMEKELTRETVDPRYAWDLTRMYASDEAWEEAFVTIKAQADAFTQQLRAHAEQGPRVHPRNACRDGEDGRGI
ncbi:MAG: hypothetical protein ACLUHE_04780 [Christensenellales bacterium]